MTKAIRLIAVLSVVLAVGVARAQHPMLDEAAGKVVHNYQQSSCEQLWKQRGAPKTQREQEFIRVLREDSQLRREFLDRVAAPIANRMFECGLIP
jgi:hypothetical protein